MNFKKCSICGAVALPDRDKCAGHAPKWQRRFFYPCKYCGGHVKSYKAKRCRLPACISRAMMEIAAAIHGPKKIRKTQVRFMGVYLGRTYNATATAWARMLGTSPALITYHLGRGKPISEIITRFTKRGGKKNAH